MQIFRSPIFRGFPWLGVGILVLVCSAALIGGESHRVTVERHVTAATAANPRSEPQTISNNELLALETAARAGDLNARLTLAQQYARGEGVRLSEERAFAYFESIANQYPDIDPLEPRASAISEAFRSLSEFYRKGIPGMNLKPDIAHAMSLLHHSASYFGDPVSQFQLARLLLSGENGKPNARMAVGWLLNASRKGYAPAQAMLGDMLWRGEHVKKAPADGLGLLALARENASQSDLAWISVIFDAARRNASADDLTKAAKFIEQNGGFLRDGSKLALATTSETLLSAEPAQLSQDALGAVTATPPRSAVDGVKLPDTESQKQPGDPAASDATSPVSRSPAQAASRIAQIRQELSTDQAHRQPARDPVRPGQGPVYGVEMAGHNAVSLPRQ